MRKLPDIPLSPCPPEYAQLIAWGWDSVQESWAFAPTARFVSLLEAAQAKAREDNESDGMCVVEIDGQPFKVCAKGTRRFRWRFENDDFIVFVGVPTLPWAVSVRYKSAGLWEHGWDALQERVMKLLRPYTVQRERDCIRVTRADYCMDYYSPVLTKELRDHPQIHIVQHGRAKKKLVCEVIGTSMRDETIQLGLRALQVQLYDKSREITEKSGKTWMYDLWRKGLKGEWPWKDKVEDVYRLEMRFFKAFLKERNCRRPHEVQSMRAHLIAEALYTRRWVVPVANDENKRRWPLHPIWSETFRERGASNMLPLGRKVTGRRNVLVDGLEKQIAGTIRAAVVLQMSEYTDGNARSFARRALQRIESDRKHGQKVTVAKDRYSDVDEAK